MLEKTVKLYTVDELSPEALQHAYNNYLKKDLDFFWVDDMVKSLDAIGNHLECNYKDYSRDGYTLDFDINTNNFDAENMKGVSRVLAFLENGTEYVFAV